MSKRLSAAGEIVEVSRITKTDTSLVGYDERDNVRIEVNGIKDWSNFYLLDEDLWDISPEEEKKSLEDRLAAAEDRVAAAEGALLFLMDMNAGGGLPNV